LHFTALPNVADAADGVERLAAMLTRMRQPTIRDVARLAEVSKSTVSNVIRGVAGVTPDKRARVQQVIGELGYRPNVMARQLVQQRTTILGVVVGDLANPFHAEMAKHVEQHAAARGYRTMFCSTQSDEVAELLALESLLEYRVAGILFIAHAGNTESARRIVQGHVPVVFVTCGNDWGDVVSSDDQHGGEMAAQHLIDLGHRKIAYFADPVVDDEATRARQIGYLYAMHGATLTPMVYRWRPASDTVERDGCEWPLPALLHGQDRVTAVFSANDVGAIKLLDATDRLGLRVPQDLSVVGFDDVVMAGLARINLTTVAQSQETLARCSVDTLAARLAGELDGEPVRRIVGLRLVVRGSTAPPAQE
jgi:LacI family transcriptional regulator